MRVVGLFFAVALLTRPLFSANDEFSPFLSSGDFLYRHYLTEIELDYAVKLTKELDAYLGILIPRIQANSSNIQTASERLNEALEKWEDLHTGFRKEGIQTLEDVQKLASCLRAVKASAVSLRNAVEAHRQFLGEYLVRGVRLVDPFSSIEGERLKTGGGRGEAWRRRQMLSALDSVKLNFLNTIPEVFSGEMITIPVVIEFIERSLKDAEAHMRRVSQMTYDFDESQQEYFDVLKTAVDTLTEQYQEARTQTSLADIFEGTFLEGELIVLDEIDASLNKLNEFTSEVSKEVSRLVIDVIETAGEIRVRFKSSLPQKPEDAWNISSSDMDQFISTYKERLVLARNLLSSGLLLRRDFDGVMRALQSEEEAWESFRTEQNTRWKDDSSEFAVALKERMQVLDRHWEWQRFRHQLAVDFADGFLKLSRFIRNSDKVTEIESAALAFMSIRGTVELLREMPEENLVRQTKSYLDRAEVFLTEWEPRVIAPLQADQLAKIEYVLGPIAQEERLK